MNPLTEVIMPTWYRFDDVVSTITVFIKLKTIIHSKSIETFTTYSHNQLSGLIEIYLNERTLTKDNNLLGKFVPVHLRGSSD